MHRAREKLRIGAGRLCVSAIDIRCGMGVNRFGSFEEKIAGVKRGVAIRGDRQTNRQTKMNFRF